MTNYPERDATREALDNSYYGEANVEVFCATCGAYALSEDLEFSTEVLGEEVFGVKVKPDVRWPFCPVCQEAENTDRRLYILRDATPEDLRPIPNPGSDEAKKQGCTCPILDNAHGHGFGGNFVIVQGCPLHDIDWEAHND